MIYYSKSSKSIHNKELAPTGLQPTGLAEQLRSLSEGLATWFGAKGEWNPSLQCNEKGHHYKYSSQLIANRKRLQACRYFLHKGTQCNRKQVYTVNTGRHVCLYCTLMLLITVSCTCSCFGKNMLSTHSYKWPKVTIAAKANGVQIDSLINHL